MNRPHLFHLLFLIVFCIECRSTRLGSKRANHRRVTDQAGAVVVGAEVNVTIKQTGLPRNVVSNKEGYFTILYLPPGQYRIDVKMDVFRSIIPPDVTLNVDQVARLDFTRIGNYDCPETLFMVAPNEKVRLSRWNIRNERFRYINTNDLDIAQGQCSGDS